MYILCFHVIIRQRIAGQFSEHILVSPLPFSLLLFILVDKLSRLRVTYVI